MPRKMKLKRDIVIPAGTILENIDGQKTQYFNGNYGMLLSITDDTTAVFVCGVDEGDPLTDDFFEEVE